MWTSLRIIAESTTSNQNWSLEFIIGIITLRFLRNWINKLSIENFTRWKLLYCFLLLTVIVIKNKASMFLWGTIKFINFFGSQTHSQLATLLVTCERNQVFVNFDSIWLLIFITVFFLCLKRQSSLNSNSNSLVLVRFTQFILRLI